MRGPRKAIDHTLERQRQEVEDDIRPASKIPRPGTIQLARGRGIADMQWLMGWLTKPRLRVRQTVSE
jgi:hypothetical protein